MVAEVARERARNQLVSLAIDFGEAFDVCPNGGKTGDWLAALDDFRQRISLPSRGAPVRAAAPYEAPTSASLRANGVAPL
jgi:hypothetical protein